MKSSCSSTESRPTMSLHQELNQERCLVWIILLFVKRFLHVLISSRELHVGIFTTNYEPLQLRLLRMRAFYENILFFLLHFFDVVLMYKTRGNYSRRYGGTTGYLLRLRVTQNALQFPFFFFLFLFLVSAFGRTEKSFFLCFPYYWSRYKWPIPD